MRLITMIWVFMVFSCTPQDSKRADTDNTMMRMNRLKHVSSETVKLLSQGKSPSLILKENIHILGNLKRRPKSDEGDLLYFPAPKDALEVEAPIFIVKFSVIDKYKFNSWIVVSSYGSSHYVKKIKGVKTEKELYDYLMENREDDELVYPSIMDSFK